MIYVTVSIREWLRVSCVMAFSKKSYKAQVLSYSEHKFESFSTKI
jgi:hypothetical protein